MDGKNSKGAQTGIPRSKIKRTLFPSSSVRRLQAQQRRAYIYFLLEIAVSCDVTPLERERATTVGARGVPGGFCFSAPGGPPGARAFRGGRARRRLGRAAAGGAPGVCGGGARAAARGSLRHPNHQPPHPSEVPPKPDPLWQCYTRLR